MPSSAARTCRPAGRGVPSAAALIALLALLHALFTPGLTHMALPEADHRPHPAAAPAAAPASAAPAAAHTASHAHPRIASPPDGGRRREPAAEVCDAAASHSRSVPTGSHDTAPLGYASARPGDWAADAAVHRPGRVPVPAASSTTTVLRC